MPGWCGSGLPMQNHCTDARRGVGSVQTQPSSRRMGSMAPRRVQIQAGVSFGSAAFFFGPWVADVWTPREWEVAQLGGVDVWGEGGRMSCAVEEGAASRGGALDSAGGCERKTAKGFPLALTFPCGEGCEVRRWPEAMGYPPSPPSQAKGGI